MSTLSESIALLTSLDRALISLFGELCRQRQCTGPYTNEQIVQESEALIVEQAKQLRSLRDCCDKQFKWIKAAMQAMHPECEVTVDPESLKGKTLRLPQNAEIEALKQVALQSQEAAKQQTERADKLQAQLADWHQVCDELWKRGYGQLPQQVNETPLGSCLRLIDQGSPKSEGYWGPDGEPVKKWSGTVYTVGVDMGVGELSISQQNILAEHEKQRANELERSLIEGANNPLFSHVEVYCVGGQVFTTPLPDTTIALEAARARLEKVPLKASDLPLGTAIRFPQEPTKEAMILGRSSELVWLAGHGPKGLFLKQLMNDEAEYRLPGTEDWKPCYKLVNPTPHAEKAPSQT